jgi:hypothetical protein
MLRVGRLQTLNFALETTSEDIFGGDALFPFDEVDIEKKATITATTAEFDLKLLDITQGSKTETNTPAKIYVFDEGCFIDNEEPSYTVEHGDKLVENTISIRFKDGTYLTEVEETPSAGEYKVGAGGTEVEETPSAGEYKVGAGGVITFSAADKGKEVLIDYQYTVSDADVNHVLTTSLPRPVRIIHVARFQMADGTEGGIQTEIYKAKAQGTFNIDFARATASTHNLELKLLDPGRADKKAISFTRF